MHRGSNKHYDEYGGEVNNRIRFAVELVQAIAEVISADKTAIRLSPFLTIEHPEDA